jgi:hypothetical protein
MYPRQACLTELTLEEEEKPENYPHLLMYPRQACLPELNLEKNREKKKQEITLILIF